MSFLTSFEVPVGNCYSFHGKKEKQTNIGGVKQLHKIILIQQPKKYKGIYFPNILFIQANFLPVILAHNTCNLKSRG